MYRVINLPYLMIMGSCRLMEKGTALGYSQARLFRLKDKYTERYSHTFPEEGGMQNALCPRLLQTSSTELAARLLKC